MVPSGDIYTKTNVKNTAAVYFLSITHLGTGIIAQIYANWNLQLVIHCCVRQLPNLYAWNVLRITYLCLLEFVFLLLLLNYSVIIISCVCLVFQMWENQALWTKWPELMLKYNHMHSQQNPCLLDTWTTNTWDGRLVFHASFIGSILASTSCRLMLCVSKIDIRRWSKLQ